MTCGSWDHGGIEDVAHLAGQRIETRFLWKVSETRWAKAVYRWGADERDALRLDGGERISIGTQTGDASYEIPGIQKCDQCHSGRIDKVLGFEAATARTSTSLGRRTGA